MITCTRTKLHVTKTLKGAKGSPSTAGNASCEAVQTRLCPTTWAAEGLEWTEEKQDIYNAAPRFNLIW